MDEEKSSTNQRNMGPGSSSSAAAGSGVGITTPNVGMNLTPATESISGGKYLSSTRASVDSDSDYQAFANQVSGSPSRPVSRSSTFSGLSTTATKDGIEGKRIRRFHDPMGYAVWLYPQSGYSSSQLRSGSLADNNDEQVEEDRYGGEEYNTDNGGSIPRGNREDDDDDMQSTSSEDADPERKPSPPNIPSAPPVTLNEKIRLLRTGSVSGVSHANGENYRPGDSIPRGLDDEFYSEAGSCRSGSYEDDLSVSVQPASL
jgi:hypothetical protein